ncbi:uncharacterized protein IUM83_16115 [Phytophthora cinnamomi]|uniref:uncharacterized protein n=1 Tax=Phytophthora cinnamomi TaxID=4785 RepID=UPI00355ABBBC|nr:hypothetical protein IUM83_16115 [Phytophthora cinnamomi]
MSAQNGVEAEVKHDVKKESDGDVSLTERCQQLEEEATELQSIISDWESALATLVAEIGRKKEAEAVNKVRLEQVRILLDEEAEDEFVFRALQEEAERQQRKILGYKKRKSRKL